LVSAGDGASDAQPVRKANEEVAAPNSSLCSQHLVMPATITRDFLPLSVMAGV